MDPLPRLGDAGIRRSFLSQAAQAVLLVAIGVYIGIEIHGREVRLGTVEKSQVSQDSVLGSHSGQIAMLQRSVASTAHRLCSIERAVHAEVDETCPPRVR